MPWESLGSTTFRRAEMAAGIEPDDCFYIQHHAAMVGKERLDLRVDPPPDLVIEVDITSPTALQAYAALQVRKSGAITIEHYRSLCGMTVATSTHHTVPRFPGTRERGDRPVRRDEPRAWHRAGLAGLSAVGAGASATLNAQFVVLSQSCFFESSGLQVVEFLISDFGFCPKSNFAQNSAITPRRWARKSALLLRACGTYTNAPQWAGLQKGVLHEP